MDRFGFQNPILFFRNFSLKNKIVFHLKGAGDENVESFHSFIIYAYITYAYITYCFFISSLHGEGYIWKIKFYITDNLNLVRIYSTIDMYLYRIVSVSLKDTSVSL